MIYPGFIGQAYRSQSIAAAGDLLINLYPEVVESEGDGKVVYYGSPGTALFCTLPAKPVRAITYLNGACFAIAGKQLFRINPDSTFSLCANGTGMPAGTSPASMQTDGKKFVVIAIGGTLWVYSILNDTLVPIDGSIVPGAGTVSYSDGYYIVDAPGTQQFYISALFDASSWNALDFGVKEGSADLLIGQIIDHRELWLMGSKSGEVWWLSGNANFPWQRLNGPYLELGLGAARSLARIDNTHIWLGDDERGGRMIWKANGYSPQRVSTFAIEYAMKTYARVDDAVAYTYQELGHAFYVITFPSAVVPGPKNKWNQPGLTWDQPGAIWDAGSSTNSRSVTWVFDVSNNMWHQRDYLDPQFGISLQPRGWVHAYAFGRQLVGDYQNGNIYDQSTDYFNDAFNSANPNSTNPIRRLRRAPHVIKEHKRISYPGFELHLQQGVVPQAGAGSVPEFNLRKSRDGGYSWSGYIEAQAAIAGQYRQRLIWRRLGDAIDPVIEVSSDEPIQHAWIDAFLTPDPVVSDR
jgi:hypothetical protein